MQVLDPSVSDERVRTSWYHRVDPLWWVTAVVVIFLIWQLHPSLLLSSSITAGGDTGAHVMMPAYAAQHIFNHWTLTGWSWEWYAGYPQYVFYFPLPDLIVALGAVIIPYAVSFKLVTVVGLILLPIAVATVVRAAQLDRTTQIASVGVTLVYLFGTSFAIDGGNIASTLAGEYDFSFSLAIGLFFLARVIRGIDRPRTMLVASVLLAASMISHALPALFFAVIALIWVLGSRSWRSVVRLGFVGLVGACMVGFWIVPLTAEFGYSTSLGYQKITNYIHALAPHGVVLWIVLAGFGAIWGLVRRDQWTRTWTIIAIGSVVAFRFFPLSAIYNGRMLPIWMLSIDLLAAVGIGVVVRVGVASAHALTRGMLVDMRPRWIGIVIAAMATSAKERRTKIAHVLTGVTALILVVFTAVVPQFPALAGAIGDGPSFLPQWVRWNYTGYEGKAAWPQYHAIMTTMSRVGLTNGCGRAMWEYSSMENQYGTPMSLMLLPFWTHGCIDSMEGLLFESSTTTPYHFLNQSELSAHPSDAMSGLPYSGVSVALGIRHLQLLGVRYFMAFSPTVVAQASTDPQLHLIATVPPTTPNVSGSITAQTWRIYRVRGAGLVTPLHYLPTVWRGVTSSNWLKPSVAWYLAPAEFPYLGVASGPTSWPSARRGEVDLAQHRLPAVQVSRINIGASSISFHVSRTGVPVDVKASYFPNWQTVGARGPYRATPNTMVVVPTSHEVVLRYEPISANRLGEVITAIAWGVGLIWLLRSRRFELVHSLKG
ncbi:MAG: hypothetical protein ACYDHP_02690 [Ferrimicrobium sp.]